MEEIKKEFESFPIHPIRMSDNTWERLKKEKGKSGKTWNKFVVELLDKRKQ